MLRLALLLTLALAASASAAAPQSCGGPKTAKVIAGSFTTEQSGGFVMVPFDVPRGTTAIRGWYCYDQPDGPTAQSPAFAIRHTIDFGYYGPRPKGQRLWTMREFRGWSGSGFFKDITVSPEGYAANPDPGKKPVGATSRGYRPGPVRPGRWAVELGVAAVVPPDQGDSDGTVNWRVELQLETDAKYADEPYVPAHYATRAAAKGPAWFAGDFHVHTDQSGDAKQDAPAADVFGYAFKPLEKGGAGLDFVQATDHNTDGGWGEWGRLEPRYPGKLIARNEEITTYEGHVNSPGTRRIADYRTGPIYERMEDGRLVLLRKGRPVSEVFDAVHAAAGVTTINHPTIFDADIPPFGILCRGCSWEYSDAETQFPKVDAIEVMTGPQGLKSSPRPGPSPFTPLAIQFYEDAIAKAGHPIAAVSGSDSHSGGNSEPSDITSSPVGEPATMVYARELSERGIADAVRAGHTYVRAFGLDSPEVSFEAVSGGRKAIVGDTVHADAATFTATVTGPGAGPGPLTVAITKNGQPFRTGPSPVTFTADAPAEGTDHYGVQVMRSSAIEAFTTPIFLTRAPARPLVAEPLLGRRLRVRHGHVRIPCRASGDGLRACRVRIGRLGRATAPLYRDGVTRVRARVRTHRSRPVTVTAIALGDGTRSAPSRRRVRLIG